MATRKIKYDDTQNNNNSFLSTMLGQEQKAPITTQEIKSPVITRNLEEETPEEKKLINVRINASLLKEWKQFCLIHDMTLTAVLKKAMRLLIKGVEDKTIEL